MNDVFNFVAYFPSVAISQTLNIFSCPPSWVWMIIMIISLSDAAKCKITYFRSARWMAAGNINACRVNVNVASDSGAWRVLLPRCTDWCIHVQRLGPQRWPSKARIYYFKSCSLYPLAIVLLQKLRSSGWVTTVRDKVPECDTDFPLMWNCQIFPQL